jgi:hypothetical protein
MKYHLIHYFDVWRDADGWQVNDLCEEAIIFFSACPDKAEILAKLKEIGFLKKSTRMASLRETSQGDADFIDFEDRFGMPIFRLERNDATEDEDCYHKEYNGIHMRKVSDEKE